MKKLLIVSILMIVLKSIVAQKIDTIYYDSNWKGVPVKAFASYMTIVYTSNDSHYQNIGKTFYITGELQCDVIPVYIDKYDANNNLFKGSFTSFYKSGKKQEVGFYNDSSNRQGVFNYYYENGNVANTGNFDNGLNEGEFQKFGENGKISESTNFSNGKIQSITQYYENGNISLKGSFVNEKINGTLFKYFEDGSGGYVEMEMQNGDLKNNYVTYVDANGNRTKYDNKMENIIQETPSSLDLKSTLSNGTQFLYYQMNGIFLAVNLTAENEVGKYYVASIALGNNGNKPILFETEKLTCTVNQDSKSYICKVYSSEEFSNVVGKKLRSRSFWNALGESLATTNAGVSTSTTTNTSAGYVNSAAVGADNNGNVAVGVGSAYGENSSSSQTQSYSRSDQYQADQNANKNISQYNSQLDQYKQALDEGYLKSNEVAPGQTITGNVNIKYQKGDTLQLNIPISGMIYTFVWRN